MAQSQTKNTQWQDFVEGAFFAVFVLFCHSNMSLSKCQLGQQAVLLKFCTIWEKCITLYLWYNHVCASAARQYPFHTWPSIRELFFKSVPIAKCYFAIMKLPFFVAYHSYVVEAGPLHMWRKNGIPKFPIIKILFIGANTKVKMWMSRIRMLVLHHKFFRQLVVFKHFTGTFHFLWRSCAHQGLCQFFANYDCNNLFRPLS